MIQTILSQIFGVGCPSDEQLMGRVRSDNDAEAFASLVSRWQTPLHRLCSRMLGDSHRAEDLTQEAFVRLFASRARYLPTARFSTYLWQIAINLCRDELRRRERHREEALPAEWAEDQGLETPRDGALEPAPDEAMSRREIAQEVAQALARLSPIYREVLVLRHYEGLKFREIADVLGVPEGTVKSRMAEALQRLAASLSILRPLSTEHSPTPKQPHAVL